MKNFRYIIIVTGLLLAMASCSDGDEITRTLEVGENTVLLDDEAQTKKVTVTVDSGEFFSVVWNGGFWGQAIANVNDGVVCITITANTTAEQRIASVTVTLDGGRRNRVINVIQSGNNPFISVIPEEIRFDFMGDEFVVEVESNVRWEVQSDVEWLDVEPFNDAGSIIIKAKENTNTYSRATTMTVTAGTSSKEVMILQDAGLDFLVPYLNVVNSSIAAIKEYEKVRYSLVIEGQGFGAPTRVLTKSKLMPEIMYYSTMNKLRIEAATMKIVDESMPDFFGKGGEDRGRAHDFILANDYEYLFAMEKSEYYWIDLGTASPYHYFVEVDRAQKYVRYEEQVTKPDPLDTPTLDALPYKPEAIGWGSHKDDAKTWESANGGVLASDVDKILTFNAPGDPLYVMREYVYKQTDDELYAMTYVFAEKELSKFYLVTLKDKYKINPRLELLLTTEGFVYKGKDGVYFVYSNTAKELEVKVWVASLAGSTAKLGALTYKHVPTVTPSGPSKFNSSIPSYVPSVKATDRR